MQSPFGCQPETEAGEIVEEYDVVWQDSPLHPGGAEPGEGGGGDGEPGLVGGQPGQRVQRVHGTQQTVQRTYDQ